QTAQLLRGIAGTVFTAGDNASPNGSSADYKNCYDPTWGTEKARTRPAPGDVEYNTKNASGYFNYFGGAAGQKNKGYYSYDLGAWHIVVLNSNLNMSTGSAQEVWLKNDLAASTAQCKLAYWHLPRFFSGVSTIRSALKPVWDDLYAAGVELVINAHSGNYERFAPQTPDGIADPTNGIREIIVGTGGLRHFSFATIAQNSEVRDNTSSGVLKLTLNDGSYTWEFIPIPGDPPEGARARPAHDHRDRAELPADGGCGTRPDHARGRGRERHGPLPRSRGRRTVVVYGRLGRRRTVRRQRRHAGPVHREPQLREPRPGLGARHRHRRRRSRGRGLARRDGPGARNDGRARRRRRHRVVQHQSRRADRADPRHDSGYRLHGRGRSLSQRYRG